MRPAAAAAVVLWPPKRRRVLASLARLGAPEVTARSARWAAGAVLRAGAGGRFVRRGHSPPTPPPGDGVPGTPQSRGTARPATSFGGRRAGCSVSVEVGGCTRPLERAASGTDRHTLLGWELGREVPIPPPIRDVPGQHRRLQQGLPRAPARRTLRAGGGCAVSTTLWRYCTARRLTQRLPLESSASCRTAPARTERRELGRLNMRQMKAAASRFVHPGCVRVPPDLAGATSERRGVELGIAVY